jgi:RimJ/RimL family protein N-acetyltransferase
MTPALETARLFLRPLLLEDADPIQRLFPQWEIVRYLNAIVPWPFPEGAALAHIRDRALPAMERGDEWQWTLRPKQEPDELIGRIHLSRGESSHRGFWMAPEWQGLGLMTEAVVAVTDYWFNVLGFPILRAPKAAANLASRRISQKTGMRCIGVIQQDCVSGRLPGELWEITAEEWRAFRRNRVWKSEFGV